MAATLLLITGGATGATLSESDFLSLAMSRRVLDPVLDAPLTAAAAESKRASAWTNPALGVDREAPGDGREQTVWEISWLPIDPARGIRVRAARVGMDAARHARSWSSLQWRSDLRAAYADWVVADRRVGATTDLLGGIRRLIEIADERTRIGEESGLALRRLRLAAVEIEGQAADAAAELSRSREAARVWIGRELDHEPLLPDLPQVPETTIQETSGEHPLLASLQAEARRAEILARESRVFVSFPELRVGLQQVREPGFESDGLTLGGSLPLPLFDRRQGDRMEARARLSAARARLDLETARVAAWRSGAGAAYHHLREGALRSMDAIEESGRVVESASARFLMGEAEMTELLETLRSVLSARVAALDLYGKALQAHRDLEMAEGRILEEEP